MIRTYPRPETPFTIDAIKARYGLDTVYSLHQNETPLGPSPRVVEAVRQEATQLGLYPPVGDETLRKALANTWGRGLSPDHFFTACSGYETIELVARAYLQSGDEVIITPPTFQIVYDKTIEVEGANIVQVPLQRPDFALDVDGILASVTDKTRLVIICNPNNPTGTIVTASEMHHFMQALPEHILVMADEVYLDFVQRPDFPDSVQYVLDDKNIVLIHTFSKAYGLPGLRLGYGIAKPDVAHYVAGLQRGYHQNRLALVAGMASLQDQDHKMKNVQAALDGKKWICDQLDQMGIFFWPSETNFVLVQTPLLGRELAAQLLPYGVLVNPMQGELDHCFRVSTGSPEGNQCFVAALRDVLAS
ncbi:MAG: histidinol-phosphate transaminase [Chloroflexota bacterium]